MIQRICNSKEFLLISITIWTAVTAARYEFVLENDEIFDSCPDSPDTLDFFDAYDTSAMTFEYMDGSIRSSGNLTTSWEGVEPTDRIDIRADIFKYQRGTWQPTLFTVNFIDFCSKLFDDSYSWYQMWTQYIPEEDRKCFNNFGHIYHHQPFDVDTVYNLAGNMEGRHKIVVHISAYDENNTKRPNSMCFEIIGEFEKVK